MKLFRVLISLVACLAIMSAVSIAQPPSPCNPCVTYCSYTQGGWGQVCSGGNVGCLRNLCFDDIYPNGVVVGRNYPNNPGYWIHLTTSMAVQDFLPQGTTPEALTQNYTDPGIGNITVFAGQVLALQLNVDYGAYGCGSMVDIGGLEIASGPFDGWTIQELLDAANEALGGGTVPGHTIAQLNAAADSVNNNFDNCTDNDGYIIIPPQGETVIARQYDVDLPLEFCLSFEEDCSDICVMWWCQDCLPGDTAQFSWVPGPCDSPNDSCDPDCALNTGVLTWGVQMYMEPHESGNGCWWYAVAHATEPGCFCVTFDEQLAANLIAFTATPGNGQVNLNWATAFERDNARFNILRSTDSATWTTVGSVAGFGQGTIATTTTYSYVDASVTNNTPYQYRLVSVDINGNAQPVGNVVSATPSVGAATPQEFALHQNYPNPFNPSTQIRFDIAEASHVNLMVFDVMGREMAMLVDGNLAANRYEVTFDASGLSSGTYFYRLSAGSFTSMNKMLVLK